MKRSKILPQKKTMIIIYPLVTAQYIIFHHENGLYLPTFVLVPLVISILIVLALGIKLVIRKLLELKTIIDAKRGN